MRILSSGGAKNGKSDYAQDLAVAMAKGGARYYVATMLPFDGEDHARIRKHRESRAGMGFETVECPRFILSCLEHTHRQGSFLLDSTTALLTNELFSDTVTFQPDRASAERCCRELVEFARQVENVVFVSDGIYSDAALYDETTELFRRELAQIDRELAKVCDTVIEFSAGIPIIRKGGLPL